MRPIYVKIEECLFEIIVEQDADDPGDPGSLGFTMTNRLFGAVSQGDNFEQALLNVVEAITVAIESEAHVLARKYL